MSPIDLALAYWSARPAARPGIMRKLKRALPPGENAALYLAKFHR